MRKDIEIDADGTLLRGWYYLPDAGASLYPAVVMAHGLSAVKEMGLDDYAEVFVAAGLAVVAYDNRNLGASDGSPRQEIDPVMQRRDYSHAITWACNQAEIDANRIGVWGTSYTGGLAIQTGILDRRVRCVVAQVPYLHALATQDLVMPLEARRGFERMLAREQAALANGAAPTMVEVCSNKPDKPAAAASRSWAYFDHFVAAGRAPAWRNEITLRSLVLRQEYDAVANIDRLAPTPLLMIVADDDDITPTSIALAAFEQAREPKHLVLIEGHHYRPYLEGFAVSSAAARDWLLEHLGGDDDDPQ